MSIRYSITAPKPDRDAPGTWECTISIGGMPHYRVLACFNPEAAEQEAKRLVELLEAAGAARRC